MEIKIVMKEMPDVIKVVRTTENGGFWDDRYIKTAYPEHEATCYHSRIVEALKAENVTLMAIIDQLQNRIGHWQVAHSEMVTEVDLRVRIAELEAILEARGL